MGDVAVVDFRHLHVPVLHPLLQLAGLADLVRRQPVARRQRQGAQVVVAVEHGGGFGEARRRDRAGSGCPWSGRHRCAAPCGWTFSGDSDGLVTRRSLPGTRTRASRKNSTAPLSSGIDAADERAVAGKGHMIPELGAQPRPAGRPQTPFGAVDGARLPATDRYCDGAPSRPHRNARAPCAAPVSATSSVSRDERLEAFGKIGRVGQPVVHLEIDVAGVFAAPGRRRLLVPDALQVRRLRARPRTS